MKEIEFKRWIKKHWPGWFSCYEFAPGATPGVADIQILVKGIIVPIELKVGSIENNLLEVERIRPAQIKWHNDLFNAGGYSFFLVAVGKGKIPLSIFGFDGNTVKDRLKPFDVKTVTELDLQNFSASLENFIINQMACLPV